MNGVGRGSEKRRKDKTSILTRETVGMTMLLFGVIAFVITVTGQYLFGEIGLAIASFFIGILGFAVYPLMLLFIYAAFVLVFDKKFLPGKWIFRGAIVFVCIFLIVHTATAERFFGSGFGAYLSGCWKAASEGIKHGTGGGVLFGLLSYPARAFLSAAGAYVLFALLTVIALAYLLMLTPLRKLIDPASRAREKSHRYEEEEPRKEERPAESVAFDDLPDPRGARMGEGSASPLAPSYQAPKAPAAYSPEPSGYAPEPSGYAPAAYPTASAAPAYPPQTAEPASAPKTPTDPADERRSSREILFGGSPADNYRNNLIYRNDSYFNRGRRERGEENTPKPTPSYTAPTAYPTPSAYPAPKAPTEGYQSSYSEEAETPRPSMPKRVRTEEEYPRDDLTYPRTPSYRAPKAEEASRAPYEKDVPAAPAAPADPVRPDAYRLDLGSQPTREPDRTRDFTDPFARREEEPTRAPDRTRDFTDPFARREEEPTREPDRTRDFTDPFARREEEPAREPDRTRDFTDPFARREEEPTREPDRTRDFADPFARREEEPTREPDRTRDFADPFARREEEPTREPDRTRDFTDPFARREEEPTREPDRTRDFTDPFADRGAGRDDSAYRLNEPTETTSFRSDDPSAYRLSEPSREPDAPREDFRRLFDEPAPPAVSSEPDEGADRAFSSDADLFDTDEPQDDAPIERPARAERSRGERGIRAASRPAVPVPDEAPKPPERHIYPKYRVPNFDLFNTYDDVVRVPPEEIERNSAIIVDTLAGFRVDAEIVKVTCGSSFTRYDIDIPRNISVGTVTKREQEIALRLQVRDGVNMYANNESGAISIEVPNRVRATVGLRPILFADEFVNAKPEALMFAIGKDVEGRNVCGNIVKMKHLLVAGATGSGKSVFLNSMLISLICKYSPEDLRLILIDPKKVEFAIYEGLPHLMINEIVTDAQKAVMALNWAIKEMERRYTLFSEKTARGTNVNSIDGYNACRTEDEEKLPKIVIVVDELADLMSVAKKDIEERIQRLAQKSRAAGIHLVLATQRPSVDVITGVIKSNLPTRIAFRVIQGVDSHTILDEVGAEKLLGNGDMYYRTEGMFNRMRVQGAYLSEAEVQEVVADVKANNEAYFDSNVAEYINKSGGASEDGGMSEDGDGAVDPQYIRALGIVVKLGSASISLIQRRCAVGYNHAGKIIEWMEYMGYISPFDGKAKARTVLLTKEEYEAKYGSIDGDK